MTTIATGDAERRKPTALVAEEDDTTRAFLADNLTADHYHVRVADSREKALAIVSVEQPDVIVVDVNGKTLDLIDAIRSGDERTSQINPDTPLIVLTSRPDELHRIRTLERGGDDVLTKPFSYPELRARLRALLRRAQARRSPRVLHAGAVTIDLTERTARVGSHRLQLPAKEYDLLRSLAADPTRVFTREELLRSVWGEAYGPSRTLDSHACRLRRRLTDAGAGGHLINVWGVGYRLIDPVQGPIGRGHEAQSR